MPEIDLLDISNNKVGTVEASPEVFDVKVRPHLVHTCVVSQLAARRSGTAATKQSRGEISGSGKKPWRQKGTGRARQGSIRAPNWRGGMTVFGPSPRDYDFKVTKKARRLALKSVLTDKLRSQALTVVESLTLEKPRTKDAAALIKSLGLPARTLFLVEGKNDNLTLAVRNLPHVDVLPVEGLNVYDLVLHEKIVCTPESIKKIEERLS
jgi:large subunit ribosomal protein L4